MDLRAVTWPHGKERKEIKEILEKYMAAMPYTRLIKPVCLINKLRFIKSFSGDSNVKSHTLH